MRGDDRRLQALTGDLGKKFPKDTIVQFNYLPTLRAKLAVNRGNASEALKSRFTTCFQSLFRTRRVGRVCACTVRFSDRKGFEHSTEVKAASVYEAACRAWANRPMKPRKSRSKRRSLSLRFIRTRKFFMSNWTSCLRGSTGEGVDQETPRARNGCEGCWTQAFGDHRRRKRKHGPRRVKVCSALSGRSVSAA